MRLQRFIGDFDLSTKNIRVTDKKLISQLKNVLRLKTGAKVILEDGHLREATAELLDLSKDFVEFSIKDVKVIVRESSADVVLYCAILKKENFELVIQKATEVGVKKIVPLVTERTIKLNLNFDRLQKIIKEAAEQSGRGVLPILQSIMRFKDAITAVDKNSINLLFDTTGLDFKTIKLKPSPTGKQTKSLVSVFIGPEGGWSEGEIGTAKENNFKIASLGKLIFRAETAAIIASYLVIREDLL